MKRGEKGNEGILGMKVVIGEFKADFGAFFLAAHHLFLSGPLCHS